nr:hypothetical protein [Tanacetum cinerariifolium]
DESSDSNRWLFGYSSVPFLYQVNLFETLQREYNTVSLTVGADPTIGLRHESWITLRFFVAFGVKCNRHLRSLAKMQRSRTTYQLPLPVTPEGRYLKSSPNISYFQTKPPFTHLQLPTLLTPTEFRHARVFPTVSDWRTSAPKDEMPARDTYSAEAVTILNTHCTPIQKQPEALLCLVGLSRRYYPGDDVYPTFLHDDDRDMDLFNLIRALNPTKVKTGTRPRVAHEVLLLTVTASHVIEMEDPATTTYSSGVPSPIERSPLDFANENPSQQSTREAGLAEEIAAMGPRVIKERRKRGNDGIDTNAPPKVLRRDHAESQPTQSTIERKSLLRLRFEQEAKLLKKSVAQVAHRDKRTRARENEIKNLEALLKAEADMKKTAEAKNTELGKELENLCALFSDLQVSNDRLSQQVSTLQAQVTGEEKLKAAFEEFKQYENDRVEKHCREIDTRLDALSIDFDEELYPHMLLVIACRRWVIGHGLRLAIMKCGESTELRQVFADVVSAGIATGMSEGLKYMVEHGKANLDLEAIEAYDPEADAKYVAALHALRDLKYPMVDQLESLKDAPIDVRDPKDPWAFKEDILLADAIAANVSHAKKKKKKCRVVCYTHGVGSAHHARSDGVPVSVPTVSSQGLATLLADAAKQMKASEDEASHYQA